MLFTLSRRVTRTLAISALVALVASGCTKHKTQAGQSPGASPPASSSPQKFHADFKIGGVRAVDAQDRAPQANNTANDVARKVVNLVNTYYNNAFIDPGLWEGGFHSKLVGLFTDEAKPSVAPNLDTLALARVSTTLKSVEPKVQTLGTVSVLIEKDFGVGYATVSTHFEAIGTPTDSNGTVDVIAQSAQFMVAVSDGYRIAGYDVTTRIDGQAKTASFNMPAQSGAAS